MTAKTQPVGETQVSPFRIYPLDSKSKIKAFIDILVADTFIIKGFRVVEGKNGLFVSAPQTKGKDDKWYADVRCTSELINQDLQDTILKMYKDEVK